MIADINITEKSFGPKILMTNIRFSIDSNEKVGIVGRNGIGKSTLFNILSGVDHDFSGEIIFKKGTVTVSTAQEHHDIGDVTVLQYILKGLPEYDNLSKLIETYPEKMGENLRMINEYTDALERFNDKGFYQIEEKVERELDNFQLSGIAHRQFSSLSGGEKRLVEVVKIMHSDADLALVDEPTNHMDYIAKQQYVDWMQAHKQSMLIITHDRDVLSCVDRIIELKDGECVSYKGNYDAYLKQNAVSTGTKMGDFEMIERRIDNLKQKVLDYQRLKEKARNPSTIQNFKRLEMNSRQELAELQNIEKPTFWIDKQSVTKLNYKVTEQYEKFKTKNIKINLKSQDSRSKHVLASGRDLTVGYDLPLFSHVNFDLCENERLELRGRNGAGKTTLIKTLLKNDPDVKIFSGNVMLDLHVRIGVYEQEIASKYFNLTLEQAIEKMYLDKNLPISLTKTRSLMKDYLFSEEDWNNRIAVLSGGQKARFQIITMLANDPQLLVLDEPTNHLDLPSIEELEGALDRYSGAVLYVSHDGYFRKAIGGNVLKIG